MCTNKILTTFNSLLLVSLVGFATSTYADDTEVFYSVNVSKPNLLFVLDASGSMSLPVGAPNTETISVSRSVGHRRDDVTESYENGWRSPGEMYVRNQTLIMDWNRSTGLRFHHLGIPQGVEIEEAYIQFTAASNSNNDTRIVIQMEDSVHALRYQKNNDSRKVRSRRYLGQSVTWEVEDAWRAGDKSSAQKTEDLSALIQSIVNKPDWEEDNGMSFWFEVWSQNGVINAKSFDWQGSSSSPPELHIKYKTNDNEDRSRLTVMKNALKRVLEEAPSNVNVGLMKYSGINDNRNRGASYRNEYVNGISFPISDINALVSPIISEYQDRDNLENPSETITVREYLSDITSDWVNLGHTPIVDSLYEAALYYRGEKMHYGKNKNNARTSQFFNYYGGVNAIYSIGSHPSSYERGAEINDRVGTHSTQGVLRSEIDDAEYKNPITSSCQSNYIVLMSDGAPFRVNDFGYTDKGPFAHTVDGETGGDGYNATIADSDLTKELKTYLNGSKCEQSPDGLISGTCGPELTRFLAAEDQSDHTDKQTIETFSIGFGDLGDTAKDYLISLATYEGKIDNYYTADDEATLADAFKTILAEISEPSGTLASPGYSVNIKNGLEHEKDIYIPVFDRKNSSVWEGNMKKFSIKDNGGKRYIQGKNNKNAVDELGGFTSDAWDHWSTSTTADGKDIAEGGLAGLINDPSSRNLYSDLSHDSDLSADSNLLSIDNLNRINNSTLGIDHNAWKVRRIQLVNFIRGWKNGYKKNDDAWINNWLLAKHKGNTTEIPRKHLGDMLHSEPVIITYNSGDDDGNGKEQYLFVGTNEGYLHAFDTKSGKEKFAFMPKELLKNIEPQLRNSGTAKDHLYGIDGTISYRKDTKTGSITLYFGLRRGGRSYYALDITNISAPKLLWKKTANNSALSTLGQSWSPVYLATIGLDNGSTKRVAVVSGGYDPREDRDDLDPNEAITANMGNDIFIFDAENGDLLWSLREKLSLDDAVLTNSIPSGLRLLDVNANGLLDRIYFADMGGNVWRLDLSESLSITSSDTKSSLALLAKLGKSEDTESGGSRGDDFSVNDDNRMFYNEPSVSVVKKHGKTYFAVSVGSGFRAHPLDKSINEMFFVLKDKYPYAKLKDKLKTDDQKEAYTITLDKLAEVSIEGADNSISINQDGFDDADRQRGWYLRLPTEGEKVLSPAVTNKGAIIFTTLVPEVLTTGDGIDQCAAPATYGRLYALNIVTGKAILNLNSTNDSGDNTVINDNDVRSTAITKVIPGKPHLIFNEAKVIQEKDDDGKVTSSSCSHPVDIRVGKKLTQVSGYDACELESVYWNDQN